MHLYGQNGDNKENRHGNRKESQRKVGDRVVVEEGGFLCTTTFQKISDF